MKQGFTILSERERVDAMKKNTIKTMKWNAALKRLVITVLFL
ncbi:hypothetical protein [Paenibacillus marinisediminis]